MTLSQLRTVTGALYRIARSLSNQLSAVRERRMRQRQFEPSTKRSQLCYTGKGLHEAIATKLSELTGMDEVVIKFFRWQQSQHLACSEMRGEI